MLRYMQGVFTLIRKSNCGKVSLFKSFSNFIANGGNFPILHAYILRYLKG